MNPFRKNRNKGRNRLERAAKAARIGDRILSFLALVLILLLLLYGGYSLWDTAMTYKGAFASSDLLQYKPTGEADDLSLAELKELNPDVCAWLTVDDTHIDYPVVRGEDNMEYVNKDVFGEFALSGAIFLDSRNQTDFSDSYSLLYGNHMDNGAMFGDIVEFADQDYFNGHKTGTLYLTDNQTYQITLFACVKVDASDSVVYTPEAQKQGDVSSLLSHVREKAVQYRDIGVGSDDHIIGLSTCSDAETNGRVVVFGRLDK